MRFSDTDNKNGILQDIETYLQLGDGAITDNTTLTKEFTRLVNNRYHEAVTIYLEAQDEWDFDDTNHSDYPIATRSLEAGKRDYELPVTEKVLSIKRVDVTYDGETYYKGIPVDSLEIQGGLGNESDTDEHFSKTQPHYDMKANHIWLYPRANASEVAAGAEIRIEFYRTIEEFVYTDSSKEPGLPKAFHTFLSMGAATDYAIARQLQSKNDLSSLLQRKEEMLKRFAYDKQEDRIITLTPYMNSDYGK